MREPGRLLLRLTHAFGLRHLRETVIEPAVADMQHECGEAGSRQDRAWALARGYWSLFTGSSLYAASLPSRHFREDWASADAAGPRLLRQAWRPTAVVAVLLIGLPLAIWPNERGLAPEITVLLLPSFIMASAPIAFTFGLGWALSRDRSGSRAALVVGLLGVVLSFAFFELAVTRANQAYRVASWEVFTAGRSVAPLRKGSRGMTLRELGEAASLATAEACSTQGPMSSCGGGPSPSFLRVEWHNRFVLPALGFSFMLVAVALARSGRRSVAVAGLWLTYPATYVVMQVAQTRAIQGDLPVIPAAWGAHLVPLTLGAALYLFRDRFEEPTPRSAPV